MKRVSEMISVKMWSILQKRELGKLQLEDGCSPSPAFHLGRGFLLAAALVKAGGRA